MGQGRPRVIQQWRSASGKGAPNTPRGTMLIAGVTEWGPLVATACSSWAQWKKLYGWFLSGYETALQVFLYFEEAKRAGRGGKVITERVVHYTDHTTVGAAPLSALRGSTQLSTGTGVYGIRATLTVTGKYYGALALTVQVVAATNGNAEYFDLLVFHPRQVTPIERFRNLTMDSTATRYAPTVVNTVEESLYITVTDLVVVGTATERRPANLAAVQALTGGDNGLTALAAADYLGGTANKTGLYAFNLVNEGVSLIVPDINTAVNQDLFTNWCQDSKGGKVVFVTDAAQAAAKTTVIAHASALTDSIYRTGVYWPHIRVANPDKSIYGQAETILARPSGSVAGRESFLANDGLSSEKRGPFSSPSNEKYGWLQSAVGLETLVGHEVMDPDVQDEVSDYGINCIISGKDVLGNQGVWIQNCYIGDPDEEDLQSVGNLFGTAFLRTTVEAILQEHLTQDNSEERRRTVEEAIETLLEYWTGRGAFASKDASEAFTVDLDPEGEGINNSLVQLTKNVYAVIALAYSSPGMWWYLVFTKDDGLIKSHMLKASQAA